MSSKSINDRQWIRLIDELDDTKSINDTDNNFRQIYIIVNSESHKKTLRKDVQGYFVLQKKSTSKWHRIYINIH